MQTETFDFLVFIGRFQPFHNGHLAVVEAGLQQAHNLIVLCGSAHQPRSTRNPWTFDERASMIRESVTAEARNRLLIAPLMDSPYNDEIWVQKVQATVQGLVAAHHKTPHKQPRIGLIGHHKDRTSYYLNLFPQWNSVAVGNVQALNATTIRNHLFGVGKQRERSGLAYLETEKAHNEMPMAVRKNLQKFVSKPVYDEVKDEQKFIAQYKSAWANAPYEPMFVTVDAVVVQSGHVLLVERKARPGKGLLALPGGFLDSGERITDACIRELKEETRIKVPAPVLKGCIKRSAVFDDPYRSARGRTITHAFYIELEPSANLPKVKGGDDAKFAHWVPLGELNPETLFEDHYFIIQDMI